MLFLGGKKSFKDVLHHENVNVEGKGDMQGAELFWQLTWNVIIIIPFMELKSQTVMTKKPWGCSVAIKTYVGQIR